MFWQRQSLMWHALYGVLLAIAMLVILVEANASGSLGAATTWMALAGLLLTVPVYVRFGRQALAQHGGASSYIYLVFAWSMVGLGIALLPQGGPWIMLFGLFPQTWAMLPRGQATVVVTVATMGLGAASWWSADWQSDELGPILTSTLVSLAVSLVLGHFIHSIISEAEGRATTIDELRRTQEELAIAQHSQGVFEERERLSREIHDTLAQGFTSILALTRATSSALERGDTAVVRQRLELIESTARDNLSEARLIVAELSPGHLQSRTLVEALERLGASVASETGMTGTVRLLGDPEPLDATAEVVLLRTAQEALSNTRRHSGASSFEVSLSYADPERVELVVADDGRGFDPDGARPGYGLDGAAARASELAADFTIDTAPGRGTRVRVGVPR